jgi:hypothetical protein
MQNYAYSEFSSEARAARRTEVLLAGGERRQTLYLPE